MCARNESNEDGTVVAAVNSAPKPFGSSAWRTDVADGAQKPPFLHYEGGLLDQCSGGANVDAVRSTSLQAVCRFFLYRRDPKPDEAGRLTMGADEVERG